MKKSELKQIIKEEISKIINETKAIVTPITDFMYLSKKNPDNKAVKVDLSKDPEINMKKDIKHVFVVTKTIDPSYNKGMYYIVYSQPSDTKNPDYWEQASSTYRQSGKHQLQGQIIKKLINIARPYLK